MKIHNAEMLKMFGNNGKLNVAIISDIYKPFTGGVTTVVEDLANNLKNNIPNFQPVRPCFSG